MAKTIYVDMDGVLSNFEQRYIDMFGVHPRQSRDDKNNSSFSANWKKFIDEEHFATLDTFPGMEELVLFLKKIETRSIEVKILTSTGGNDRHNDVAAQKLKWVKQHDIHWPLIPVPGRRFKSLFADKNTFMIDDTHDVIYNFIRNGGNGILHTTPSITLPVLENFLA
jgi:5' nucleotidase, deoxy (Pyrimidine), cytosolic type C protein (NT5C)